MTKSSRAAHERRVRQQVAANARAHGHRPLPLDPNAPEPPALLADPDIDPALGASVDSHSVSSGWTPLANEAGDDEQQAFAAWLGHIAAGRIVVR